MISSFLGKGLSLWQPFFFFRFERWSNKNVEPDLFVISPSRFQEEATNY